MPSYVGIGTSITHNVEVDGNLFLQDIEGGPDSTRVPLEIFSNLVSSSVESANSRMLRLRVQNYGETNTDNSYVTDMGIRGDPGKDYFFITAPQNTSNVGDQNTFVISSTSNVGIGTTDPAKPLHVVGDSWITGTLTASNIIGASPVTISSNLVMASGYTLTAGAIEPPTGSESNLKITGTITTSNIVANTGDNLLVSSNLEVGTSNLFVDTATGNVGIGTLTPRTTLDVFGDLRCPSNEAQRTLGGGRTVTWSTSGYIKWSNRLILLPVDSVFYSSSGFLNIDCPTSGTISVYLNNGTTSTVTCTSDGIPISDWRALYYVIEKGQTTDSDASRFILVDYSGNTNIKIDSNWVYICGRNGDDNRLKWMAGPTTLPPGATYGVIAWTAPTLLNSWVNYGDVWSTAGYYKDENGRVHLKGLVKNGTIDQNIFVLPAGFRPSKYLLFPVQTVDTIGRCNIKSDGGVQPDVGSANWFSLDGISFLAEQ
jgi:hypothetical protein